MTRINLIRSSSALYFITTRSKHHDWYNFQMPDIWTIFQEAFREAYAKQRIEMIACILLVDCYHFLIQTPEENLDKFMYEFNKRFSKKIREKSGRINKIFSGPYKRSLIESARLQKDTLRFLAQGSFRIGCAGRCENYPYLVLRPEKIGELKSPEFYKWLNERLSEHEIFFLQAKLKRSFFREEIVKTSRRKLVKKI